MGAPIDRILLSASGPTPVLRIDLHGLAHINFAIRLFDSSGTNVCGERQGTNAAETSFAFNLDMVPLADLGGRIVTLVGIAADFAGGSAPYEIALSVAQGQNSTPMTIAQPAMSGGIAAFSGSMSLAVQ